MTQALGIDPQQASMLVPLNRGGTGTPLFLIHPLQGHVACYVPLVEQLDLPGPVFGIKARGLVDPLAPLPDSLSQVAEDYAEIINAQQPEQPILLGGWSLGGLTALEVAHVLRRRGREVALLITIDHGLKQQTFEVPKELRLFLNVFDDREFLFLYYALQERFMVDFFYRYMRLASLGERLDALTAELMKSEKVSRSMSYPELHHLMRLQRAFFDAGVAYQPDPRDIPVTYVMASDRIPILGREATLPEVAQLQRRPNTKVIHGSHHMSIINTKFARQVALHLRKKIEAAMAA